MTNIFVRKIGRFDDMASATVIVATNNDPDHAELVKADIWIKAPDDLPISDLENAMKAQAIFALERALAELRQ
jgi:hypothetical protein